MDLITPPESPSWSAPPTDGPPAGRPSRGPFGPLLLVLALAVPILPLLWLDGQAKAFNSWVEARSWVEKDIFVPLREFGSFVFQASILLAMLLLDPARRRKIPYIVAAIILSFLAVQGLKIVTGRTRPEVATAVLQFTGPGGGVFNDRKGSFPSGHTAAAFTLAAALAFTYPRGRWLFFILAAGCGLARVAEARHFPTDCYVGALIGIFSAKFLLGLSEPARPPDPPSG
jgi:membrane-associated phospholipid phosphatase